MSVTYNFALVIVSALIAVTASYLALELSSRLLTAQGTSRRFWLIGGAIAMGTGIWSMHFVAMLAFSIPIYLTYNLLLVLLSLVLAILAALQALLIVSRPQPQTVELLAGAGSMGIGIALMHYSGMAAMEMPAVLHYQPKLFVLSVVIAIVVSLAALKLAIRFRQGRRADHSGLKLVTACLMGGAVLSMHYTGMAAAVFVPQPGKVIRPSGLDNTWLAYLVCTFTVALLGMMVALLYSEPKRSY
jgi:NO-binding membrane sensor protein with MHYT domain